MSSTAAKSAGAYDEQVLNAAAKGDVESLKKALASGANVNAVDPKTGDTPLIVASHKATGDNEQNELAHHFVEVVDFLIKSGATVNATNNDGATAVYNAVWNKNVEMVLRLIKGGANVNASDHDGFTPLLDACYNEHTDLAVILLSAGANVNAANNDGDRPLIVAAKKGNEDLVKILIKAGANVNLSDNEGWTPLISAAYKGHRGVCKILLNAGANKNLCTATEYESIPPNKDAAQVAATAGNTDVVALLKGPIHSIPFVGPVLSFVLRPFVNAFREH
uniref:Ankyrin repeat protein n=1 Tax=Tetraselmis sp. GSL018 TaxID=582737 RepID=A0A061R177_9CHLO|mmetsp:Transcript_30130/g.71754  ORF Transcript_30130/g.71754 Transcript_30130/m.71754 type:complete len:278 (-) Transcript_30130:170-1003(-)|eukprot:CAMPEP_0177599758 /NCGR_PEP_ID=MMETSP0419_2-20121207/13190_1 /TAXON_ID=582737 /ORGANISM="Tetraselmis sp., Strain GSL018" /LENGTH=277 /DNA_ID=CAMNT_0019092565 /DNA_START=132 /DNA_END=965 /DNA_ORIENTATION=+